MDKNLKNIEEIDYVLNFLATSPYSKGHITHAKLWDILKETEKSMTAEKLLRILNKLTKDIYVEASIPNNSNGVANYKISFDGLVQNELGGYHELYIRDLELREIQHRQNLIQEQQIKSSKQIVRLTFILVISSAFAAIYYLIEICKIFTKC